MCCSRLGFYEVRTAAGLARQYLAFFSTLYFSGIEHTRTLPLLTGTLSLTNLRIVLTEFACRSFAAFTELCEKLGVIIVDALV